MDADDQLDFDDICRNRHHNTPESVDANPTKAQKRKAWGQIVGTLEQRGSYGITLDEMAERLDVPPNQISGRFTELVVNGTIIKTDRRRATRTGKGAVVYVLNGGAA